MNDPNPLNDVEQRVRTAWEARCGLRRGPLEQADIDAIAEAAFALEGVKPTVEFIRRIAGGGSPNTIHPKLDAWFRQGRQTAAPSSVPTELLTLWERLQADAARVAQEQLAPRVAALTDDRDALTAAQAQLAVDQAALAAERATTERVVTAMREEFRALQTHHVELTAANEALRQSGHADAAELGRRHDLIEGLRGSLATAATEHAAAQANLTTARAEGAAWREERDTAREALVRADARITSLEATMEERDERERRAGRRLDELGATLVQVRAEVDRLMAARRTLETDLASARAAADAAERLRDHLATDLARERDSLADTRAGAHDMAQALAATQAHLAAVTTERDRLHNRLDAWASARAATVPGPLAPTPGPAP